MADEEREHGDGERAPADRPWVWAVCASLVLIVAVALLAGFVAERRREARYRQAPVCERAPAPPAGEAGCVHEVRGVVEAFRVPFEFRRRERYVDYRLLEPPPATARTGTVELDGDNPRVSHLSGLDREIVLGLWEGRVTRIRRQDGGLSVETVESPLHRKATPGVGLLLLPPGALGLWAAFRLRRRSGSWQLRVAVAPVRHVPRSIVPLLAGVGASYGVLVPVSRGRYEPVGLLVSGVACAVLGGILGLALYRWRRRRD